MGEDEGDGMNADNLPTADHLRRYQLKAIETVREHVADEDARLLVMGVLDLFLGVGVTRADDLNDAILEHAGIIVAEMERYYRDGRHPDLRPVLRAGRALLELTGEA